MSPIPIAQAIEGLVARAVRVRVSDVVFVKGLLEASEGLGSLFAERGGDLTIASPPERADELDALLADLVVDLGAQVSSGVGGAG